MKAKILIGLLLLLLFTVKTNAQHKEAKNYFAMGIDMFFSDFDDDNAIALNFSSSYEINFRKLSFLTIDPVIGAGHIWRKRETVGDVIRSQYKIPYFTVGVAPKLQISNPDNDVFFYLENELSFWNGFAGIEDEGSNIKRNTQHWFNFFYSPKLGITVVQDRWKWSFWIGVSTLSLNRILNDNLPQGQKKYSDETLLYRAGLKIHF